MKKWNCLIIDDYLKGEQKEKKINALDEVRVEIAWWNEFQEYNFEDYDVFFIDFENNYKFDHQQPRALRSLASGELKQIKFIFTSKIDSEIEPINEKKVHNNDIIHYLWSIIPPSISTKGNKIEVINPEYSLSKLFFNEKYQSYHWTWAIEPENLPNDSYVLAKNKKGNIISLIVKFEQNFIIFLPHPSFKQEFIEKCLANIDKFELELFKRGLDLTIKKPKWLKDYDPFNKTSLVDQSQEIKEKIKRIESYEILLYGYDKSLEKSVSAIFSFLGFQNITRTVDREDISCETENTKILAEIKGLKNMAHEKNINQMYKWRVAESKKKEESVKKLKLIFICNAYRDKKPEERGDFFDQKVIEISEFYGWGLLSTQELYNSLLKIWNNELKKEEVVSIIENQSGIIVF